MDHNRSSRIALDARQCANGGSEASWVSRPSEGISRAKARGVKLGRPFGMPHHQRQEPLAREATGEPVREIARSYNVSPSIISRL